MKDNQWEKTKEYAAGQSRVILHEKVWMKIQDFIDAALEVDNLNMSMAREDMDRRIFQYNKVKKELLGDI